MAKRFSTANARHAILDMDEVDSIDSSMVTSKEESDEDFCPQNSDKEDSEEHDMDEEDDEEMDEEDNDEEDDAKQGDDEDEQLINKIKTTGTHVHNMYTGDIKQYGTRVIEVLVLHWNHRKSFWERGKGDMTQEKKRSGFIHS